MGGTGRGMGMGSSLQSTGIKATDTLSKEKELKLLKIQAGELKKQMDDIDSKIRNL
jgi:hypothetical protein